MNPSKLRGLQKFLFQLLILLLPTQLSYFFWPDFAHVLGIRVDYLAPTIYLTDLLVVAFFITFFLMQRREVLQTLKNRNLIKYLLVGSVIVVLNLLSSASIFPALFKWFKLFELFLFGFAVSRVKSFSLYGWVAKPLMLSVTFFSLIAVLQFMRGGTLGGVFYYLGERTFNKYIPGIAKFSITGHEFLRPYSTFPHPNSLSGFFGASLLFILVFLKEKFEKLKYLSLTLGSIALILSSSLGAFLSLIASFLVVFLFKKSRNILIILPIIVTVSLLMLSFSTLVNTESVNLGESLLLRLSLISSSGKLIQEFPLFGVGLNNFTLELPRVYPYQSLWWLQPVHNIFLLILTEGGVVGLILFVLLLIKVFNNYLKHNEYLGYLPVLFILLTGMVDHYWLTLQQNLLLFAFLVGLSFRKRLLN